MSTPTQPLYIPRLPGCLFSGLGVLWLASCSPEQPPTPEPAKPVQADISVVLAGDTVITQPWSHLDDPDFLRLIEEIRGADVAIANLETLIHEFKGYPQARLNATYMASRPEIARELVWAGFDMVGHANNHTYDYGDIGVLENQTHVRATGLVLAGSGRDLQEARAPAYFQTDKGSVALIAVTATFQPHARATRSRPDLHGKPGPNPLELHPGEKPNSVIVDQKDLEGNLAAIRQAATNADVVVLSIHAHKQGKWLVEFARSAIDAGADICLGHGPHAVRGVEIYRGKPIFYGLGNFVFQNELIEKLPAEFYERFGLGDDATPEQAQNARSQHGTVGFPAQQKPWEGIIARVDFSAGKLASVRLTPVDLGFGQPLPIRGRPKRASGELARHIIHGVASLSEHHGTRIYFSDAEGAGIIDLHNAPWADIAGAGSAGRINSQ
ncbi:MAG TPA: CapA family protein [Verrucomicrobia bacterium]|nr:CapA family protein [Verrucomicrobiota bacterium]HOP98035.1 CapA family protein [Verrucomicrobiota bacterium]HPU56965.1 CapA family protein [Verrucomicrobiota bacterium]